LKSLHQIDSLQCLRLQPKESLSELHSLDMVNDGDAAVHQQFFPAFSATVNFLTLLRSG
jgi:hypothetical protein